MKNLYEEFFTYKDSHCNILSDCKLGLNIAKKSIINNRNLLEKYVFKNPVFLNSLKPVFTSTKIGIIKLMEDAASNSGVGPMAAVAGAIADVAVRDMVNNGCKTAVVENGGEVSVVSESSIDVALVAGNTLLSKNLGFRLVEFPVGVATSSGKFSHALSFGDSDSTTVFCETACLADAAATAVGNVVKGKDHDLAIKLGINKAKTIPGVKGVLIVFDDYVGTWGKFPQIIKVS